MEGENLSGLSPSEEAYFNSGGETEVVNDAPLAPEAQPDAPLVENEPGGERDEKGRFVPHQALHAEREEHKKTRSELAEIRKNQAILEDRWNTLLKVNQPAQEQTEDEAAPNPDEDIFAYVKWQDKQLAKLQERVTGREKQEQEAIQAQTQEQELWREWSESAKSFSAEKTDFGDAVKHLSDMRTSQLRAYAAVDPSFADEAKITGQINNELKALIQGAKASNKSPAEVVYEIAKGYGYAPSNDPAQVTMPDKLANISQAQTASRTLASSNGSRTAEPFTAQTISDMPAAEFERWVSDPANAQRFKQLMGG